MLNSLPEQAFFPGQIVRRSWWRSDERGTSFYIVVDYKRSPCRESSPSFDRVFVKALDDDFARSIYNAYDDWFYCRQLELVSDV